MIYDAKLVTGRNVAPLSGRMRKRDALDRLLAGSGVSWKQVNEMTVMLVAAEPARATPQRPAAGDPIAAVDDADVAALGDVQVSADPLRLLPNVPSTSAFGFSKLPIETPRSMSSVSSETIDLFGLSAVEDLVRLVPGTFTTTRFGIQGSVDLRNVPADFYFRGMKRLSLQGHGRSVLGALDTIDVVRGPPSPDFRHGEDRRLHQRRADVGACSEWHLYRRSRGIRQGGRRILRSKRVVVRPRWPDRGVWQARRLLPSRPVRRLGFLRARRSDQTAAAAGGGQHRRIRRSDAPRARRQYAGVAHGRCVDRTPDAGPRRPRPLHPR